MSMDIKALDSNYIMHTYGRNGVVIDRGKGSVLYGDDGKEYLDFGSGIGTLSLGTADSGYIQAVTDQLLKTQHVSNYFMCAPTALLAEKIISLSGFSKVFFANSGAEANEGAIKTARKYSFDKYGKGRSTIVTFDKSFHGRTVTTLAATGQDVFHQFFFPFTDGFKYCEYNNEDALKSALTDDVCAVMLECIQGEGGVNVMTDSFASMLKEECEKRDILIICDEIQTGIGRTGKLFAFETLNLRPNIFTLAKGLAGGLPIGAFVTDKKCSEVLSKGQHGSTFGGNPVSCAAANYVLDKISAPGFLQSVTDNGNYLRSRLKEIKSDKIMDIRGKGLMVGIQTSIPTGDFCSEALNRGLFVLSAGKDVIRLLPPLIITKQELEHGIEILDKLFCEM